MSNLNKLLNNSTGYRYFAEQTPMEELTEGLRRRRKRRGEPRRSARGHITRFGNYGRWISLRVQDGKLEALHATKGWRRVSSGMAQILRERLQQSLAQRVGA